MKMRIFLPIGIIICLFIVCAAPITILQPPIRPLKDYQYLEVLNFESDVIGEINETIMQKIMKKSCEDILESHRFSKVLLPGGIDIDQGKYFEFIGTVDEFDSTQNKAALLKVVVVKYEKGSEFIRFLFGSMAGSGKVQLELAIYDRHSKEELSKAETIANITGSFSSENDVVDPLSKAVSKYVKEQFEASSVKYSIITLIDTKEIGGEIKKAKENELYLAKGNTIFIIKRAKIDTITENGIQIAYEDLLKRDFGKINYVNYPETKYIK